MKPQPPQQILLVDDDSNFRNLLSFSLKLEGYDVVQAPHGEAALSLLLAADRLPSLILLNLLTPVMDGWRFREIQKNHLKLGHIPVMLMASGPVDEEHLATLEAITLFRKPIDLEAIRDRIREHLEGSPEAAAAATQGSPRRNAEQT